MALRRLAQKQAPPAAYLGALQHDGIGAGSFEPHALALRRLTRKQAPPAAYRRAFHPAAIADEALEAEAWAEITALGEDKQRQHAHNAHVKTADARDRQPHDFSRAEFYAHLEQCYAEAYPQRGTRSKSIILFGAVVKEAHAAAADGTRHEHHHAATY